MALRGKLRFRCKIETSVRTQDAAGQPVDTWSTLVNDWPAGWEANEQVNTFSDDKRLDTVHTRTLRVNYKSTIASDQRLTIEGSTYEIVGAVDPDGRRRYLLLTLIRSL